MAQYDLIRCLCPRGSDLLVVGDDDQSIYGWRGACVDNILLSSRKTIQTLKRYDLKENYRSTRSILDIANWVIANTGRLGKELWTERADEDSVQCREFSTQRDEAQFVGSGNCVYAS